MSTQNVDAQEFPATNGELSEALVQIAQSVQALAEQDGELTIAAIPILEELKHLAAAFSANTAAIERDRRQVADIRLSVAHLTDTLAIQASKPPIISPWLERYQTLLTGLVAILTALIGLCGLVWVTWHNAKLQRQRDALMREQTRSSLAVSLYVEVETLEEYIGQADASLAQAHDVRAEQIHFAVQTVGLFELDILRALKSDIGILGTDIARLATKLDAQRSMIAKNELYKNVTLIGDQFQRVSELLKSDLSSLRNTTSTLRSLLNTSGST